MEPTALLPLRRKARWGLFRPKNPKASAGFEPANLGTKGQHAQTTEAALYLLLINANHSTYVETSAYCNT